MAKKISLENLAGMVKRGFDETGDKIEGVKKEVEGVKEDLKNFREINTQEHEEIKLRLNNVAYRFELVELVQRVERLEKIAGILKRK